MISEQSKFEVLSELINALVLSGKAYKTKKYSWINIHKLQKHHQELKRNNKIKSLKDFYNYMQLLPNKEQWAEQFNLTPAPVLAETGSGVISQPKPSQ